MYLRYLQITVVFFSIATASLQAQNEPHPTQTDTTALLQYVQLLSDSIPEQLVIHYIYPFDCVNCLATMRNRLLEEKEDKNEENIQGIILFPGNSSERRVKAVLKYMEVTRGDRWLIVRDDRLKLMVEQLRPPGIKVSHTVVLDMAKERVMRSY